MANKFNGIMSDLIGELANGMGMFGGGSVKVEFADGTIYELDVENKKIFCERMEEIMEEQVSDQDDGTDLEAFYEQTIKLANDLYDCVEEFEKGMCQKWDNPFETEEMYEEAIGMQELNLADYGSDKYCFERISKAKLACKEAVQRVCGEMGMSSKNIVVRDLGGKINKDVSVFIDEFLESFDDYVVLYCVGKAKAAVDIQKRKRFSKNLLNQMWNRQNLQEKISTLVQEDCADVQTLFEKCTYDKDESGMYCYHLEPAFSKSKTKTKVIDDYMDKVNEEYVIEKIQKAITKFALEIKMNLLAMAVERV